MLRRREQATVTRVNLGEASFERRAQMQTVRGAKKNMRWERPKMVSRAADKAIVQRKPVPKSFLLVRLEAPACLEKSRLGEAAFAHVPMKRGLNLCDGQDERAAAMARLGEIKHRVRSRAGSISRCKGYQNRPSAIPIL
jgi:hypothetical protein